MDIVATTGKTLVFIEVKTRTSDDFGSPSESIDQKKVLKIRKAASCYLVRKDTEGFQGFRFDIIAIMVKRNKVRTVLEKIKSGGIDNGSIMEISLCLFDNCRIEHIEAAF